MATKRPVQPNQPNPTSEDSFESTYHRFITHPHDEIGHLAFSLWYRGWLTIRAHLKISKYNNGPVPESEFIHHYQCLVQSSIDVFRKTAEEMLVQRYERLAISIDQSLKNLNKEPTWKSLMPGNFQLWQKIAANFWFVVIVGVLTLLYSLGKMVTAMMK